jgi:hypothetical protein
MLTDRFSLLEIEPLPFASPSSSLLVQAAKVKAKIAKKIDKNRFIMYCCLFSYEQKSK